MAAARAALLVLRVLGLASSLQPQAQAQGEGREESNGTNSTAVLPATLHQLHRDYISSSNAAPPPTTGPTLRDHTIAGPGGAIYLDGADWTATRPPSPAHLLTTTHEPPLTIAATVPGDIITDLQRAGVVSDPYYNTNWREPSFVQAWNGSTNGTGGVWVYSKQFATPPTPLRAQKQQVQAAGGGGRLVLVLDGIRMGSMVYLNGVFL